MSNQDTPRRGNSTRSVHAGEERRKAAQSLTNPIAQTSTFVFEDLDEFTAYKAGEKTHFEYGRYGNPTMRAAEQKLAALDGAEDALLFNTGMSAVTTVLWAMLRAGQHLIVMEDCYRRTVQFCNLIAKFGVESTYVKPGDWAGLEAAVQANTRVLFAESPTNPHLHVMDLEKLVPFAKAHRLKVIIDSTFATPINQRPLEWGVDLVIHSATKYLGGHNDLMAGSVCGKGPIVGAIKDFRSVVGTLVDPNTSYLLIRGLKTLGLRMERQNVSSLQLAHYLEEHPKVAQVYYPGLPSHPDHEVAKAQMDGFGGVVSFDIAGDLEKTRNFIHALELPYLAPSLGGVESLVSHPATISYYDLSHEERLAIGIKDELVRYSVGIEEADELIADIEQALGKI
ncbi:MAG: aminotransferase class I/II-fold pyridoxal phosphate-dependent enzyme [Candidatus Latescibacteria bacterium]|nr:aminotransferase class I/II-fold pyridoxal phosphate-dependent enzyme [Candidatus Latescibacterota bacterium]